MKISGGDDGDAWGRERERELMRGKKIKNKNSKYPY